MTRASYPRPLEPGVDLRSQLADRVIGRSLEALDAAEGRRQAELERGAWRELGERVRAQVRRAFGPMPFGRSGGPLHARLVSAFDTRHCRVENVLFDSYPGWQVNASVFVPKGTGPFPAVVIPVGHSGKQFDNYQLPAQAFASLGFLAVLFDPPGQASERQIGNDHFHDGVRCHLTGLSSNRYFVLDALRSIDYLETRADADLSRGVGMTGVSGGGHTTVCATLFDGRLDAGDGSGRIACQGPSCCLTRLADHPVGDAYSACPETLWWNRIGEGVDEVDLVLGALPVPTVYMAGIDDEVFRIDWSRELARVIGSGFRAAGAEERFSFFEDRSGHAYTLRQVELFAAWMNRWVLGLPESRSGAARLEDASFTMLDPEMLSCRPSQAVTMFSLNREAARELAAGRPRGPSLDRAREAVRALTGAAAAGTPSWREGEPMLLWTQEYREALCDADGFAVPVSLLTPAAPFRACRWVLWLDEGGRRSALEAGGPATRLSRLFDREAAVPHPAVAVADLPGWGDSEPALLPFTVAGWGSRDRALAYLSAALGDSVLAMQARAAAGLVEAVSSRAGADVVVVGRGLGGVVALLAAALTDRAGTVVAWSSLASFELLASSERYAWPASAFLPNALREIDLPELAAALAAGGREVLVAEPLDAERRPLGRAQAAELYAQGAGGPELLAGASADAVLARIEALLTRSR